MGINMEKMIKTDKNRARQMVRSTLFDMLRDRARVERAMIQIEAYANACVQDAVCGIADECGIGNG